MEHLQLESDGMEDSYWTYNCPLQIDIDDDTGDIIHVVNYMAWRDRCVDLEEKIKAANVPAYCRNAAKVLRNLASLYELAAEGKIKTICYPSESLGDALRDSVQP